MFNETNYMKTQDLLERGLNNAMFRRKVIADNLANADVPNFKRSEVTFEANLKRAIHSEETMAENALPTRVSNEKHFEFFTPLNYKDVKPKAHLDYITRMRADGNNIDVEKEVVTASQNQMLYTMMVERYNQNSKLLNIVMRLA